MWKELILLTCLSGYCSSGPVGLKKNMPIIAREDEPLIKEPTTSAETTASDRMPAPALPPHLSTLTLPSNATSIRADITEGFSCKGKPYGYYADVENECQIFHVCLPVTYADGKENIFRWSFICPEETIFSQDSFTCMRQEDMNIECEESFKYYELNRNFGVVEEETPQRPTSSDAAAINKETSLGGSTTTVDDQDVATSLQEQQFVVEEKFDATTAAPQQAQPSNQKDKPMKQQKPNRRKPQKPSSSTANKKQPTNTTYRKESQPLSSVTETAKPQYVQYTSTTTTAAPAIEEVKTSPPRFNKRPAAMYGNLKEKIQTPPPVKVPEPTPIRIELFNQKRKRPTVFNKKDTSTAKPAAEGAATDLAEPSPTSHFEFITISTPLSIQQDVAKNDQPKLPLQSNDQLKHETSLLGTEKDAEPQASETATIVVKPNAAQPLKDILPPVVSEEDSSSSKPSLSETTNIDKAQEPTPIEVIEEIPAIVEEVFDAPQMPAKETSVKDQDKLTMTTAGEAAANLEELESAKPADAIETMQATAEMEHQHPMVEDMYEQTKSDAEHLQPMGGFKPVDPEVAAEAEALISDFLSTLMKSEQNQKTEIKTEDKAEEEKETVAKEEEKKEDNLVPQMPTEEKLATESTQKTMEKLNSSEKPQQFLHSPQMMLSALPAQMFQIPVQVITTQEEEAELQRPQSSSNDKTNELSTSTNSKPPLSIDDVVELVKEQLDQKPTTETLPVEAQKQEPIIAEVQKEVIASNLAPLKDETIMPIYQRVTELAASSPAKIESKTTVASSKTEKKSTVASDSPKKLPQTQARKEPISVSTSSSPAKVLKKRKVNREKNSRDLKYVLVDPRKRRFLFRSDAS